MTDWTLSPSGLLPDSLAHDRRLAAFDALLAAIWQLDTRPMLLCLVDMVAAQALPWLADQFSLIGDGWELAESDDARRRLIKGAIELHCRKGTPWALRELIRRLGLGEASLIEGLSIRARDGGSRRDGVYVHGDPTAWAQYRVLLRQPIANDQATQLRKLLDAYAPARCELASLEYQAVACRRNGSVSRNRQFNRGSA
ncbi:phage tail protein I [Chromobacterium subtsugae]|uniref:Phage tail protein I n=1 Tax=Chromobacterium subtsugae TaxID=251747 RepID=A0ABS7FJU5_9NEIS|nr:MULTISPECIES: phage tail protein I [Chromobacterium]KUM02936.1 phage tail protein [Chromobacterium subtsugae]KZE84151.1 phage tail protein [Chromobacterium sp. F49]MBW7568678.1 phage tail protein I [Chromobacterium subtsugae]MBW8290360.1 phage tail protein I [Chromobacterium subtsugae]WSE93660.1 phage tail protein I [Chromobacterium subtsugae]